MRKNKKGQWEFPWWGIFLPLITTLCLAAGFTLGTRAVTPNPNIRLVDTVHELVIRKYVEPKESDELIFSGLAGMMDSLDRHSRFYPPQEAREVENETQGKYEGIGIVLNPSKPPLILFPMLNSPGEKAGLLPGDQILAAGDVDISQMELSEAIQHVKGPANTSIRLTIKRGERDPFEVAVQRGDVKTSSVIKERILEEKHGIAYLALKDFQAHTCADVDQAWENLKRKGAKSMILDLRFNGGGNLAQTSLLINRFLDLDQVPLVKVIGRVKRTTHDYSAKKGEARLARVPLVVLVNRYSASASEVFAAAIQDYGRGVIVGTRTFGKGTVQSLFTLPKPNESKKLKFTIARYATSSGLLVEPTRKEQLAGAGGGVVPDYPITMSTKFQRLLRSWQETLDPPAKYAKRVLQVRQQFNLPPPRPRPEDPQLEQCLNILLGQAQFLDSTKVAKRRKPRKL